LNRIPEQSLLKENMKEPININEASFEKVVINSPIPVLVDFWAPWCGPCKIFAPLLDEIARESEGRFRVAKINVDDDPALMQRFAIRAVPSLLFFSGGELRDRIVGGTTSKAILDKLEILSNRSVPA
jgi:thioredoxin 1